MGSRARECVLLKKADASESTVANYESAYARAFEKRDEMPYFVLPEWCHIAWSFFWIAMGAVIQRTPVVLALIFGKPFVHWNFVKVVNSDGTEGRDRTPIEVLLLLLWTLYLGYAATFILVMFVDITAKWKLIGRREASTTLSWDESSYCQRWQLYLSIVPIRHFMAGGRDVLECFLGSEWLCIYFRLLGATIGSNVCLYPNGADPMMTEPEMVTIENGPASTAPCSSLT